MAGIGSYESLIEAISRSDEPEYIAQLTQTESDVPFFGFKGLDHAKLSGNFLYRVLGANENIQWQINCKDPNSPRSVEQHIASGSKKSSKFISTTYSSDVAALWAFYEMDTKERNPRVEPLRIVEINMQVLVGTIYEQICINLNKDEVRNHFIKGQTHRNWAKSSQEVLFQYNIPEYIYTLLQPGNVYPLLQPGNVCPPLQPGNVDSFGGKYLPVNGVLVYYERVYRETKEIGKPLQPPPKKAKKKSKSLEEGMAKLLI